MRTNTSIRTFTPLTRNGTELANIPFNTFSYYNSKQPDPTISYKGIRLFYLHIF